jgi:hypothetical protein
MFDAEHYFFNMGYRHALDFVKQYCDLENDPDEIWAYLEMKFESSPDLFSYSDKSVDRHEFLKGVYQRLVDINNERGTQND